MGWNPDHVMPWDMPPARQDGCCDTCGQPLDHMGELPRRPTLSALGYRYHAGCNAFMDRMLSEVKAKSEPLDFNDSHRK